MPRVKFLIAVEEFAYASPAGSSDDYSPLSWTPLAAPLLPGLYFSDYGVNQDLAY
jgi:hypothetical protein